MKKYLLILLAFLVLPFSVSAVVTHDTLQFPQATNIYIPSLDTTVIISAGAEVESLIVNAGNIVIGGAYADADNKSTITFTSNSKRQFGNDWGLGTTCGTSTSSISITWASDSASTITLNPVDGCVVYSGGGGGGGGGSYTPPTTPTTPTCSPACVHGTCAATNTCTCTGGYTGTTCSVAPTPTTPTTPVGQMTQTQLLAEVSRIATLIAQLQAQLAEMQGEDNGQFITDLYYGMRGNNDVKKLQQFLIDRGYLKSATATGNYLSGTRAAVRAYQTAKGISPVNGRFGPLTRAAANADLGF